MRQQLHYLSLIILFHLCSGVAFAQNTITTQVLSIASICPGSTLDVPFTTSGTYLSGNVFTVQLSNGSEYVNVPTGGASYNNATGLYTVTATIPVSTAAGTAYQVRVTASSPAVTGTPSPTQLVAKVKPAPPGVANQTLCQQYCLSTATCAYYLSGTAASGATIQWYDPKGVLYTPYSYSSVNSISVGVNSWQVGETQLSASQVLDGCESDKTPFTLTLNPNKIGGPSNGSGLDFAVCQSSPAVTLDKFAPAPPAGFTIQYSDAITGQRYTTLPVIPTDRVATYLFSAAYVSDKGCTHPQRNNGAILARVVPAPAKPSVLPPINAYCHNKFAVPLSASVTEPGTSLVWYGPGALAGPVSTTALRPSTTQIGTFTYTVAQAVGQCESERASIEVNVDPTPPRPTVVSSVTNCLGQTARPLSVTGTGLTWYAPAPMYTETFSPSTLRLGTSYYSVTQRGPSGCESEAATIESVVLEPPGLVLSGSRVANLGEEVPIGLKFSGVGPYRYTLRLDSGEFQSGAATKDTVIMVLPPRTTIYYVTDISSYCGSGAPVSTAKITVTVPTIQTQSLTSATVCAGSTLTSNFLTMGQFNQGSTFRLQLARTNADTTKIQYADLPNAQVTGGQISASIPTTATAGTYLVRVMATNPKIPILGTPSATTLTIRQLPGASLTASQTTIYEGEAVKLSVSFTGDGPWTFVYRDSSSLGNVTREILTNANPHVLDLKPQKPTIYRLTSLSNGCGTSLSLPAPVLVTVNPLLAVEPLAGLVRVFPVPVVSVVTVEIDPSLMTGPATLMLVNEKGSVVQKQATRQPTTQLNLAEQPAGVYILQIRIGEQLVNRRLLKQ